MTGAERTMQVIRRNMVWALTYNLVGVVLAMTGTINPLIAAIVDAGELAHRGARQLARAHLCTDRRGSASGAVPTPAHAVEVAA